MNAISEIDGFPRWYRELSSFLPANPRGLASGMAEKLTSAFDPYATFVKNGLTPMAQ